MSGGKALQWITRDQSMERFSLPSCAFVGDAVSLEISGVEGQQIPVPFGLQVGDDRPQPIKRIDHLAAMLEREIYSLPVAQILEAENPGRGGQRQKPRSRQDQRTSEPPQGMAQSKDWHWPLRPRC